MRHFEDFAAGDTFEYGTFDVTAEEIVSFAQEFDPQPFHLDEAAAKASLLGGLATSGWQTAAISMRLHVQNLMHDIAALGSPGILEMRWPRPVMAGHRVRLRVLVHSARLSQSRPGMGILELHTTMLNQHDEELMQSRGITLVASRNAPAGMRVYDPAEIEKMPLWQEPADILRDPAAAPGDAGWLSGWYDDIAIGRTIDLGSYRFDKDNILAYARKWDPQSFHIDELAAKAGPFGSLIASGWHTGAAGMRRNVLTRQAWLAEGARRGLAEAPRGPSPGFRDLRWLAPVFPGDEIHYYLTPREKRATSRPGWGLMFTHHEGINQHCRKVYEYTGISLWPMRKA